MRQIVATLLMLIGAVAFSGCKDGPVIPKQPTDAEPNVPPSTDIPAIVPANTFEITGTVVYKNIEGGFFAIDADDGKKYDPIGLPEIFRKDGLKVKVTARLKRNAVSFHMYGAIIEIVNITTR